jgi:hypothetical protein
MVIRMEWTDRDFLIQAADLVVGTETITPQRGDQVKETVGSIVTTYEVAACCCANCSSSSGGSNSGSSRRRWHERQA